MFLNSLSSDLSQFENFATKALTQLYPREIKKVELLEAILYSFNNGGKRFRPALTLAISEILDVNREKAHPWCLALEMIHTYSLIHDDLPCMDNDDWRRGKPTNHKVYGESVALLAGDALLTEAFGILAHYYSENTIVLANLIKELTHVAGLRGMIGGQFLDMSSPASNLEDLKLMHQLKTGALISGCLTGPGILKQVTTPQLEELRKIGEAMGFLFQVKDDILDAHESSQDVKSIVPLKKGVENTQVYLLQSTQELIHQSEVLFQEMGINPLQIKKLFSFLEWNQNRTH